MKRIKLLGLVLLLLALVFPNEISLAQRKMIQIKGSDTMVNLAQILAEKYMEKNPRIPIAVLGGGSGTGIVAIINGTCDIANLSREILPQELKMAKDKGIFPRQFTIAVDGLSLIVHPSNPVDSLTMNQIGAIYRGEIKRWKDVGGLDAPISLYGRQSNSGTYGFFQELVMGNQNYSPKMLQLNGNAQIVEGIIRDKHSIGYVGVGYVLDRKTGKVMRGLKILSVSNDVRSPSYSPLDKDAVDSGNYPIARPLYQSTAQVPQGHIRDFVRFEIGTEGQKIVESEGFFPIGPAHRAENEKNLKSKPNH